MGDWLRRVGDFLEGMISNVGKILLVHLVEKLPLPVPAISGTLIAAKATNTDPWELWKNRLLFDAAIAASVVGSFGVDPVAGASTASSASGLSVLAPDALKLAAWWQQSLGHQMLGGALRGALGSVGSQSLNAILSNQKFRLDLGSVFVAAATSGLGAGGFLTPLSGGAFAQLGNTAVSGLIRANIAGVGSLIAGHDYGAGFSNSLLSSAVRVGTHKVFEMAPASLQDYFVGKLVYGGLQSAVANSIAAAVTKQDIRSSFVTGVIQGATPHALDFVRDALVAKYLLPTIVAIASPINVDANLVYDDNACFAGDYSVKIGTYRFEIINGKFYFRLTPDGIRHDSHGCHSRHRCRPTR